MPPQADAPRPPSPRPDPAPLREWVARLEAEMQRLRNSAEGGRQGTLQILLERELARKRAVLQVAPALRVVR